LRQVIRRQLVAVQVAVEELPAVADQLLALLVLFQVILTQIEQVG
jgi:hypothetical protein